MEAMRVKHLSKNFGGLHAVSQVSFSIQVGECLAIIGPNGAGKTTLFNLLNGQLSPSNGSVYFFGKEITNMAIHRRAHLGLARTFQLTSLFPDLPVLYNVFMALHGTKPSRFEVFRRTTFYDRLMSKARELLFSVDLWEKRNEPAKAISYGEQRKLEIVLGLASEPRMLLLDEPSAGLTADEGNDIIDMLRNLGSKMTVIFVDHDMDLVFGLADRIIVLHNGKVIAEGTPEFVQENSKVKEIYMGLEENP